tara:strand:+ start:919 stop:1464 length:546 start_codon:yes stop_codon:yes gene_type:complete
MSGWLYLIKNGDLYKIGITKNFNKRMRQLKPDYVVAKLYTTEFKQLERELHYRYKKNRIPQSEYFRLKKFQIDEIKQRLINPIYTGRVYLEIFIKSFLLLSFIFLVLFILISLNINDLNNVLLSTLSFMDKISFFLSLLSLLIKSDKYLNLLNEVRLRCLKSCIFMFFGFLFSIASRFYFE